MRGSKAAELVLGSVQLGLAYGAANRTGKPTRESAIRLVRRAQAEGIATFDTARAYGDSEERLGEAFTGSKPARTITKLSPLAELQPEAEREDVRRFVDASIRESCDSLRVERLHCLLLHRAVHRTAFGGAIWERLLEHVQQGTIASLGVSVQSPAEALDALNCPAVQHVQLPFNLLDWRWKQAGIPAAIALRGNATIHARSIFLQGILAANDVSVWPRIAGVDPVALTSLLAELAEEFNREGPADLCLAYIRGQDWIDGAIIGMETEEQLETNLRLSVRPPLSQEDCEWLERMLPHVPEQLLNPTLWPAKA